MVCTRCHFLKWDFPLSSYLKLPPLLPVLWNSLHSLFFSIALTIIRCKIYFIYLYVCLPPPPPRKCKLYGARELSLFCSLLKPQYLDLRLVYAGDTINEWISPYWYFCNFMQTLSAYIKIYLHINTYIFRKSTHILLKVASFTYLSMSLYFILFYGLHSILCYEYFIQQFLY